jgi:phospholipid/cholesterol/gamma-HCH transport system substrate-binding protein
MRRSVREALVGFSLLAAVLSGVGLWFWLRGLTLSRGHWTVQASFADAAGLANRSPVYYRGVMVGRVSAIEVSGAEVIARLEITDADLRLARPLVARVGAGSLLGGDMVVSLVSAGKPLPPSSPAPRDPRCDDRRMICHGGRLQGVQAPSLETVTATVQSLLDQVDRDRVVKRLVRATDSFDKTAEEIRRLSRQGQTFVGNADQLVTGLNAVVGKTDPIVTNLQVASLEARQATHSVKRLTGRLEDPKVVEDLQATLANARRLTDRWEAVGSDVQKLTGDPAFVDGMRQVSVGLGRFFADLYPGTSAPPAAEPAATGSRSLPYRDPSDRMAPRSKAPATVVPPR